jgi:hypothetical protein
VLPICLASPSSLYFSSSLESILVEDTFGWPPVPPPVAALTSLAPFLSSFTRSAYLRVLRECSQQLLAGETLAIMVVFELPVKESFST